MLKERLSACLGIFIVMGLSNAIVPVLPSYSGSAFIQGGIYAAYFLGAFIMTLPAGILSDRFGRSRIMMSGLVMTIASGILLMVESAPVIVASARVLEGTGAGLFVAASMAFVNSLPDHTRVSGFFLASLNAGLVSGLIIGGYAFRLTADPLSGIGIFTVSALLPLILSMTLAEKTDCIRYSRAGPSIISLVREYRWLWYSAVILIGVTGVVTAIYPEFSNIAPEQAGTWIASMSIFTIIAVLIVSRMNLLPVPTIRIAAVAMAAGTFIVFYTPLGFLFIGAVAGIVMIAQMAFLAQVSEYQGAVMGLFSTTSYLGMSLLPFITGFLAEETTFFIAFFVTACLSLTVALTIGKCACRIRTDS
jgi:MFS family permease